jgi:endoglucanase
MRKAYLLFVIIGFVLIFSSSEETAKAYYTSNGQYFIDRETNDTVILRGFGLGCWLLPEGYMWGIRKLDRPYQFEQAIEKLIGKDDAAEFWHRFRSNFLVEEEIRLMKSWGCNTLRIPLLASMLQPRENQPENAPYLYSEKGFSYLDSLVKWCEKYRIGIIWDLHGSPGSQNGYNISDGDGTPRLWTEKEKYWPLCLDLWHTIAERYKNSPCISGYDILNEPVLRQQKITNISLLRELSILITKEIRKTDSKGIIFLEGDQFSTEFACLEPFDWDKHLALGFHSYPPIDTQEKLQPYLNYRQKYNVALWMGETGETEPPYKQNIMSTKLMLKHNVSWSWWTHKKLAKQSQPWISEQPEGFKKILQYWVTGENEPSKDDAKKWLFEMAEKTNLKYCTFLPDMVRSLIPLNPLQNTITQTKSAPLIVHQPESINVSFMENARFEVHASGNPIEYQWFKNGIEMPGETYFIMEIKNPDEKYSNTKYKVKVYNEISAVFSNEVSLNVEPFKGPYISFTDKAIKIDALSDDAWTKTQSNLIANEADGKRNSPNDLSGEFKMLYDSSYLYLLVNVIDDKQMVKSDEDYSKDCIEIYFDGNNDKPFIYGSEEVQFRYHWNDTATIKCIYGKAKGEIKAAQRNTGNGYCMEIAFPWSAIYAKAESKSKIGFDIQINDNDSDHRKCKLAWKAKHDISYKSPDYLGIIELK